MAVLRSVWEKFAGKSRPEEHLPFAFSASIKPEDEQGDKFKDLWYLQGNRQLLEARIEGSSLSYQTIIVAIDVQRGLLWLDDLFPSQHLLEAGDMITLRHHRNEEQLVISAPLLAWGKNYGAQGFAIALPEQVNYLPRRRFPRVELSSSNAISVKIRPMGQDISQGNVQDISAGGLRLSVPGNLLGQLRHGALMPLCELRLSDELHIRCSARIRAFRLVRNLQRYTQISIEFADMAPERRAQLEQFVNNLQYLQSRELARHSA
jgi:c-di-GMP-binding flagellar brake protein YcgR